MTIEATAAAGVDFFQYVPKTKGTRQPAKTMSNASIKYVPGLGIIAPSAKAVKKTGMIRALLLLTTACRSDLVV